MRDIEPQELTGDFGRGIEVGDVPSSGGFAEVLVSGTHIERTRAAGLAVVGASAVVDTTLVRATRAGRDGESGGGLAVFRDIAILQSGVLVLRDSVAEQNQGYGVYVGDSEATLERCALKDNLPSGEGFNGDAVVAVSTQIEGATVTVTDGLLGGNARAGLASFGSRISLKGADLQCNAVHLNGEEQFVFEGEPISLPFQFDDRGENICGCADADEPCAVRSTGLTPPRMPGS